MDTIHQLHSALIPESVAVIGASERVSSRGTTLWKNLVSCGFNGRLYPVNPKYRYIGEAQCYSNIQNIEDKIDLAVLAIPSKLLRKP